MAKENLSLRSRSVKSLNNSEVEKKSTKREAKTVKACYSFPDFDHDLIEIIKIQAAKNGVILNNSEVLRIGLHCLNDAAESRIVELSKKIVKVRVGRPKN